MSKVSKISEPVGFGKSSLTGHRPIRNVEADVRAVQTMLSEVPADKIATPLVHDLIQSKLDAL